MLKGLPPLIPRRRSPWPWLVAAVVLAVVFFGILPRSTAEPARWVPALSFAVPKTKASTLLRPFDFIDNARERIIPEPETELETSEPDGPASLHDQRNPGFYQGGVLNLTSSTPLDTSAPLPVIYDPYPEYNTKNWRQQWKGTFRSCTGPRGDLLRRTNPDDMMLVYRGNQRDFPFPAFGSHEAVHLDANVCTDRCTRWGAYGYREESSASNGPCHTPLRDIDWDKVRWGSLQDQCAERNAGRYATPRQPFKPVLLHQGPFDTPDESPAEEQQQIKPKSPQYHTREAVLIRSWSFMEWTENHKQYLRSVIMELALHSGAEYEVFLLVDVKDENVDLTDSAAVEAVKEKAVPPEFRDMVILFSEPMLSQWYPLIDEHKAQYQHLQPIQAFAELHPHFDHVLQFEMDARNTGHAYHFLDRSVQFARQQPRKFLWERNAYFYTPGAHGSWHAFSRMVDRTLAGREDQTVWGPVSAPGSGITPRGPKPPVASAADDSFRWGVGEDPDLMTLLPIFETRQTTWTFPNHLYGDVPPDLPRRASVITMWRISRRLLHLMHTELAATGKAVVSEMSAPTWALLHGFKAVAVPQPLWVDGMWTSSELARAYNPGVPELINGGVDSVWNWNHMYDRIMFRLSYMFTTQHAEDLFRRWLGWPIEATQQTDGRSHHDPQGLPWFDEGVTDETKNGRMCLPPMLLHTIKNTKEEKYYDIFHMAVPV